MNGLYSPIDQLLMMSGGLEAVLEQPYAGDYRTYDPAAPADYAPSQPQRDNVTGIWSVGQEIGLQEGETAAFLVSARDLSGGQPRSEQATLTVGDVTYKVARVGHRVYRGQTDGYVLFLAA